MNTLINAITQAHISIKFESVLEDWLICQAPSTHYPKWDLSLMYISQLLVNETGVGYHLLDFSVLQFDFHSYGSSLTEEELEALCRKHQEDFQQEHDEFMAASGIYY